MRVALFKGRGLFSRAIRWTTRSPYSHAAILTSDGTLYESREGKGVQKIERWTAPCEVDLFDVEGLTPEQEEIILTFLALQLGKRYDWRMVWRHLFRINSETTGSVGKWYCSELVFAAFKKAGITLLDRVEPWAVSPGMLAWSSKLRFAGTL